MLEFERLVTRDDHRVLAFGIQYPLVEDVVRDHVVKDAEGRHDVVRHIGQTQVFLEAELRFEAGVADLVDVGAGVYAVGGYLRDVWRAVTAGEVEFDRKPLRKIIGSPQASRHARKHMAVVGKGMIRADSIRAMDGVCAISRRARPGIYPLVVEGTAVKTDAAGDVQLVEGFFDHRKGTDIELGVVGDDKIGAAGDLIVLVHPIETGGDVPAAVLGEEIFDVVGVGV